MTEDADATSILWNDSYIAYIPLLGGAVALTFDVGYFYAIDINFFTVFSLSEHLVFAIQAFPIALVFLITSSVIVVLMGRKQPPPINSSKASRPQRITAYVVLTLIVLALILFIGYLLFFTPEMLLVTIELIVLGFGIFLITQTYRRVFIALMVVLITLTASFLIGYWAGRSNMSTEDTNNIFTHSIETITLKHVAAPINGRIVRSGDRGVLLYDRVSNRLRFVLWEAIESIEATPHAVGR